MPKKVKRGKKKASTEKTDKISINIKNIIQQARTEQRRPKTERQAAKRRQAPDIIRPLGKRPIEASAFDNQYRLQNPSVTYASTPLANMASLRDLIQAPSAPQVTGQLALRHQSPATNPNQILPQLNPSTVLVKAKQNPGMSDVWNLDLRSLSAPRRSVSALLYESSRPSQPQPNALPVVGQRLDSIAENTSQRLVAEAMDQDSRDYARLPTPPRSDTVQPIARAESPTLPSVPPIARASAGPVSRPRDPNVRRITMDMIEHPHHPQHAEWKKEQARLKKAEKARFKIVRPPPTLIDA